MPFVCKSTIYILDKSLFKFDNQTICKSEWQMIKELQDINWKLFGLPCTYSTAKTALFIYCYNSIVIRYSHRFFDQVRHKSMHSFSGKKYLDLPKL